MNRRFLMNALMVPVVYCGLIVLSVRAQPHSQASPSAVEFNEAGQLVRPTGYRQWVYIGTPHTPNDLNPPEAPFPDFHNVYIDPPSYARYMETGRFPDGTVLVKELVEVGSTRAVSGKGYFMGEFIGLETAIKSAERFPDEPGNWAYFSFGHSYPLAETAEAFPTAACNTCHLVSAADDFVFTQYYPVLRAPRQPRRSETTKWTRDGKLVQPESWREWVYVGTPLTPNDLNPPEAPFPDFHNVYIPPNDFAHYQRTGKFRDGTILIKELVSVGSKGAVSGRGYFMGEFTGLEATVKDSKRFPHEPGNWAYFTFGHSYPLAAEAAANGACHSCHQMNAQDDLVFTQYYPVLRAAKRADEKASSGGAMTVGSKDYDEIAQGMAAGMATALQSSAKTPPVDSEVPVDLEDLARYLKSGAYKNLPHQETNSHPSRGPHSKFGWPVRVFMDEKMNRSLASGAAQHPKGASIVKEMFTDDGDLQGWAVMVKTQDDSQGGDGWFWYETTNVDQPEDVVAVGNGVPLCYGCHSVGNDFFLSSYPLK